NDAKLLALVHFPPLAAFGGNRHVATRVSHEIRDLRMRKDCDLRYELLDFPTLEWLVVDEGEGVGTHIHFRDDGLDRLAFGAPAYFREYEVLTKAELLKRSIGQFRVILLSDGIDNTASI